MYQPKVEAEAELALEAKLQIVDNFKAQKELIVKEPIGQSLAPDHDPSEFVLESRLSMYKYMLEERQEKYEIKADLL